jgi:hypothetical protein
VDGLSDKLDAPAETVRVTFTFCGLLPAAVDVIVTVPLYVPALNPLGLIPTFTVPGVVPLAGEAVSHAAEVEVA